jgi:hypothetical protein
MVTWWTNDIQTIANCSVSFIPKYFIISEIAVLTSFSDSSWTKGKKELKMEFDE